MSEDEFDDWRRLLRHRDELESILDPELEDIRNQVRDRMVKLIREAIDEVNALPASGRADREVRRQAELSWLSFILAAIQPGDA